MSIITLTSDFGLKDHFIASAKGLIYRSIANANIIDVSHEISPFNLFEASYVIKNAIKNFPDNSINIIAVDSEYGQNNKLIVAKYQNQFFITANNGILSFVIEDLKDAEIYELNYQDYKQTSSLQKMIQTASHLAKGGTPSLIGNKIDQIKELTEMNPQFVEHQSKIIGVVIYIDNYGNVISNITKQMFNLAFAGKKSFEITFRNQKISKIYSYYREIENDSSLSIQFNAGKTMALFNSEGYLEIAIYRGDPNNSGGASTLLGLKYRDSIVINFS